MNIRIWAVWVHPTRDDMVLQSPQPVKVGTPIESAYMEDFIKNAARRGGARIHLEQKGSQL